MRGQRAPGAINQSNSRLDRLQPQCLTDVVKLPGQSGTGAAVKVGF
jgi:hypothetical protein